MLVNLSLPVFTPEGTKIFKCQQVFLHVAAVGPRLILGYPFLLSYGLAVVPGQEALVQVKGCFRGLRTPRYQHGKPQSVHTPTAMVQVAKPKTADQQCAEANPVNDITGEAAGMPHPILNGKPKRVSFDLHLEYQHAVHCEGPCQKMTFVYTTSLKWTPQSACPHCGPSAVMNTPQVTGFRRREGVVKPNILRIVQQLDLENDSIDTPPPEPATPMGLPGTWSFSEPEIRPDFVAGLHVYPSPLVHEATVPSYPEPPSPPSFTALVETHTRKNPLKVKLLSAVAIIPTRGSQGAAGYDLYAPRAITIPVQQQVCIPLDLAFQLPVGTYGKIQDRSGNAVKHRLRVGAGVIDCDFWGNVGVVLKNEGLTEFQVHPGDKIAQMTLELNLLPKIEVVQELSHTQRGSDGWGSTDQPRPITNVCKEGLSVPPPPAPSLPKLPSPLPNAAADDVPLIHPHCPPGPSWHTQFMSPFFLYVLYMISTARRATTATAVRTETVSNSCKEYTGPVTRARQAQKQSVVVSPESETSPETPLQPTAVDVGVALLVFCMPAIVSAFISGIRVIRDQSPLVGDRPPIPGQKSPSIIPRDVERRSVAPGLPVEIAALLDRALVDAVPGGPETLGPGVAEVKTVEVHDDQYGITSEAESEGPSAHSEVRRMWGSARMSPDNVACHVVQVERDCCDLQQLDLWADSGETAQGGADPDLSSVRRSRRSNIPTETAALRPVWRSAAQHQKTQAREKKFRSKRMKGAVAVRQCVVDRIMRWIQTATVFGQCPPLTDAFASKSLKRFDRFWDRQTDALFQPWNEAHLWLRPPNELWEQCVPKLRFDGARGVAIQPVRRDAEWWWDFGEVVLDWIDISIGSPLFEDAQGMVHTTKCEYRIALFDAFCSDAEGEGWGDPEDVVSDPHTVPAYKKGWSSEDWDSPSTVAPPPSPHRSTFDLPAPHPAPSELLRPDSDAETESDDDSPYPHRMCRGMKRKIHREQAKREKRQAMPRSDSELGMCANSSPDFSDSSPSLPQAANGINSLPHDQCDSVRSRFGHRARPPGRTHVQAGWTATPERHIRSVIQADEDWSGAESLKETIMEKYSDRVFRSIPTHEVTEEAQAKRGPHAKVRLQLKQKHAGPRADKPIRAVGPKESALYDKVMGFKKKGMLRKCEGDPQWVARAFLVPKPGGKWRLVIDYRHLNSCLEGKNFPLPVIEDQLANEQGNFLYSLIDFEDGFHQMHSQEDSKHLTAFCTPFGVFEWNVLPMGVKVGPAAFQEMVQHVTRNCPSSKPYIDDIMSSNGKEILDPQKTTIAQKQEPEMLQKYFQAHAEKLCALFDALAEAQLTVKPEKCHLFKKRVQYVGHILQNGQRFPSPAKTEAVRQWQHDTITTTKQLKGFLGLVGWYQVYIPKFAEMAAPLMDALKGKYQYAPPEAADEKTDTNVLKKRKRIKLSANEARIHWSDEMKKSFEGLKSALNAATGLYLPKPGRPWRIRCDASDYAIGGALEQEQEDGGYHPVAFFSRKLQGQRAGQGGSTRNTGQYA